MLVLQTAPTSDLWTLVLHFDWVAIPQGGH
jgi:hypothetical protein